jgi:hypothetical protein
VRQTCGEHVFGNLPGATARMARVEQDKPEAER